MSRKSYIDLEGLHHYHKRDNLTHHIYTKLGGPVDNQKIGIPFTFLNVCTLLPEQRCAR
jgi:hypothetical protein